MIVSVFGGFSSYAENAQKAFYVSTSGSDENDGTIDKPFLTLQKAQEAVRACNENMTGDITVFLREGSYRVDEPLEFTEKDSGTGGYNVIWSGYNGETAKISGGKAVTGWKKHNDKLWVADYDGSEYVRQLWVNGKRARRAQSEVPYDISELFKVSDNKYKYDGVMTAESKFADYKNQEDIQIHFSRGWKSYLLNVERIEKTSGGARWFMYQPAFSEAEDEAIHHNIDAGHDFYVENAFEELDREGEFYFNRAEKKIYYMPRQGEDINKIEAEAAYVDKLLDIRGENANNRIHNIVFKNLEFAHATWNRVSKVGLVNDQAQWMHPDPSDTMIEPGYKMVPANIQLDRAEKIQFIGNKFYDFGAVCIGMYQGVINCKIIGNQFYDIADSAVTIGTEYQPYVDKEYKGYNLAGGKVSSASSFDHAYYPMLALDSNGNSGWSPNGSAPHWWQVDLEDAYEIDRIEVDARLGYDQKMTRNNFEILGSNDPEFKTYKVLAVQGVEAYPHEGTAVLPVDVDTKFRYIRARKTNDDYFYIADIRIINESMEYAPITETCKNVQIQNNYITRTGLVNFGGPGIQAYYVENIDISHNEIQDVSYSGICVGWGWSAQPNSVACKDNKINYNRIDKPMQSCFDGGAIYMLGQQPNSQIIGNYVSNQPNNLAGIYLDSGSRYFHLRDNVIENTPVSFYSAVESGSNRWEHNYATSTEIKMNSGTDVFVEDVNIFAPGDYPYEALVIMDKAGLTDEWKAISGGGGENLWAAEPLLTMDNAKHEVIYHLMSDTNFVGYYLKYFTTSATAWLNSIEVGNSEGQYPESAVSEFKTFLDEAIEVTLENPVDRDKVLSYKLKFLEETEKLKASKIRQSYHELLSSAEAQLKNTVVGTMRGMIAERDYNTLGALYANTKKSGNYGMEAMLLDGYLKAFDSLKINLDVYDVTAENQQIGKAVVDKENKTVDLTVKYSLDYAEITPQIKVHDKVKVAAADTLEDGEATYVVSTADGSDAQPWKLRLKKPEVITAKEPQDLAEAIADESYWYSFGTYGYKNYYRHLYGDGTLEFTMNIEARENDWPSLVFRSQEYQKSFQDVGNSAYIFVFTPGFVELHRFDDGVRTQFYGLVPGCVTIYGESVQSDAFKFGEDNQMRLTTENTAEGVHIVLEINGEKVIDCLDSTEGAITQPGYIGTVSPVANVLLGGRK